MSELKNASLFGIKHFIFGFIDLDKKIPVVGAYIKKKDNFIIDYSQGKYKEVYDCFTNDKIKLPVVTIDGVKELSYTELLETSYLIDSCFIIDNFCYNAIDVENKGYLLIKNGEEFLVDVGLEGSYHWSNDKKFSSMYFKIEYDDYFEDILVNYRFLKNIYIEHTKKV